MKTKIAAVLLTLGSIVVHAAALTEDQASSIGYLVRALPSHPLPKALCVKFLPGLYKTHAVVLTHPNDEESVLGGVSEGSGGDAELENFTFMVVQSFYEDDGLRAMTDKQIGAEFVRQCAGGEF